MFCLPRSIANLCRLAPCRKLLGALLVGVQSATLAEPASSRLFLIEQPSAALGDTLEAIARHTGTAVVFDWRSVGGHVSAPLAGRMTPVEAIRRAVHMSGFTVEIMDSGAVVVRSATDPSGAVAQQSTHGGGVVSSPPSQSATAAFRSRPAERLASAASGATSGAQRIEVTGTRLKRPADGALPVLRYRREDIERSGSVTLERFLAGLSEASVSSGEGALGMTSGQGAVQLRGLPLGSTLVLLNGRRLHAVGSSSANFFNLNLLPLAAIERVDVVPVGSSAVYGGDGLAGVVNIVLKRSMDGSSFSARAGTGTGISDRSVSIATGREDAAGSHVLLVSTSKSTPLTMAERPFFRDADYRRLGGADVRGLLCTPGTVSSVTGGLLPGLGASLAGIPVAFATDVPTVADFVATAGRANRCSSSAQGRGIALIHGGESIALHAALERDLGRRWLLFGELTYIKDRLQAEEVGLQINQAVVPAANPFNPFGVPVRVSATLGAVNGLQRFVRDTNFTRMLAGLRGEPIDGWELEFAALSTMDRGHRRTAYGSLDATALDAALGAAERSATLNPFTGGRAASEDVVSAIWPDSMRFNRGGLDQVSGVLRGAVAESQAGEIDVVVGGEFGRHAYATEILGELAAVDKRRSSSAMFGEFKAHLVRSRSEGAGPWTALALSAAVRRDRYHDFGSAITHQAGLELRPAPALLLRTSVSSSFKPPTMLQTGVEELRFPASAFNLVDPARGGEPISAAMVVRGTNPGLRPERGSAQTVGVLWHPAPVPGTRLGMTAWRVRIDGMIGILQPQTALDHEALFPGFIIRTESGDGQPGPVARVNYAEVNYGRLETAGVDLEASHAWTSADQGRWLASVGLTKTTRYDVLLAPVAPSEDRLGRRFADFWSPAWKATAAIGWTRAWWTVDLASRLQGSYRDEGGRDRRLGGRWTHTLSGRLDLKRLAIRWPSIKSASLSMAIANLGNRQPDFVETPPYYDVTQADWRGRYATVRLSLEW